MVSLGHNELIGLDALGESLNTFWTPKFIVERAYFLPVPDLIFFNNHSHTSDSRYAITLVEKETFP